MGSFPLTEHLLRRAGFSGSPEDIASYAGKGYEGAVDALLGYDPSSTDVDGSSGTPGFVGVTTRTAFSPNTVITDSRQRWLFRMVHSPAPLQEKMALLWHNHFATAYSKISAAYSAEDAARMMAAKPSEDPAQMRGQIELFRQKALGSFEDLLIQIAQDPAMLVWLDGRTNTKTNPQENFGRELMELFTSGVANYVEADVYAAARVFTGWNLATPAAADGTTTYSFVYNSAKHETTAKDFSFPIYADGTKRIPARSASAGMQDGLDLIHALAYRPETAQRLAQKLWAWFVSEVQAPDPEFVNAISSVYLANNTVMKPVIRAVLVSKQFMDSANFFARYEWPAEYVIRLFKEVGYLGFSVNDALTPLINMGQQLFEPPDVSGWDLGTTWFSTGAMLSRMNFAAQLATNQKFALRDAAKVARATPDALLSYALSRLTIPPPDPDVYNALLDYVREGGTWTGSDAQLLNKAPGLFHLLTGSGDYQFV